MFKQTVKISLNYLAVILGALQFLQRTGDSYTSMIEKFCLEIWNLGFLFSSHGPYSVI